MAAVLVAEDDRALREFVARALLKCGYDVTAVADGAQALDALATTAFDAILADIAMPELDGLALAGEVARSHPDLPIALMSGDAAERDRAADPAVMAYDVIAKPFTLRQIRDVTMDMIRSKPDRWRPAAKAAEKAPL